MKPSNLTIRIPEPCTENWDKMQPDNKGKFCNSCSKSVVDFSNKTDNEIRDILIEYKDQKVCGHFKKTQVNRPLSFSIDLNDLPKNISSTKAFAIALFLVFGTFLFSCTNPQGKKVETVEVTNNIGNEEMMGDVIAFVEPVDSAKILPPVAIQCSTESTVMGLMMPEETIDSLPQFKEIYAIENYVMGGVRYVTETTDSTANTIDSTEIKNTEKLLNPSLIDKQTNLSIYPNPSTGDVTIKYDLLKRANVRIDILDLKGSLLKTIVDVSGQFDGKYQIPVNVSEFANGIYIVTLINNGERFTQKLIIEK